MHKGEKIFFHTHKSVQLIRMLAAQKNHAEMPGLLLREGLYLCLKRLIEYNTHQAANTRYRPGRHFSDRYFRASVLYIARNEVRIAKDTEVELPGV